MTDRTHKDEDGDYLRKAEELVQAYKSRKITEEERLECFKRLLRDYFKSGNKEIIEAIVKLIWIGRSDKTSDKFTDVLSEIKQVSNKELNAIKRLMKELEKRFGDALLEYNVSEERSDEKTVVTLFINYYGIVNASDTLTFELVDS